MNDREKRKVRYEDYDKENLLRIKKMCGDCRFYEGRCLKERILRECAVRGWKNRD